MSDTGLSLRLSNLNRDNPANGDREWIWLPARISSSSATACSSPSNRMMPSYPACRRVSEAMSSRVIGAPGSLPRALSTASRSAGSRKGLRFWVSSSVLSPMPSASNQSLGSLGAASAESMTPSPSESGPATRRAATWKRMMSSVLTASAPSSSSASTPQGNPLPQSARGSENTPPRTHWAYAMMVPRRSG